MELTKNLDELILHIGTHKTGSTAIQRGLEKYDSILLRDNSIVYPKSESDPAGHPEMAWSLRNIKNMSKESESFKLAAGFIEQAVTKKCARLLLSSEVFSTLPHSALVHLKQLFPAKKYTVIIYFRRQDSYLESAYGQHVKMYIQKTSDRIFEFHERRNFADRMNYGSIVNKWATVFGKSAIRLSTYEGTNTIYDGVLKGFLDTLEIKLSANETSKIMDKRVNKSLSPCGVLAMATINRNNSLSVSTHQEVLKNIFKLNEALTYSTHKLLSLHERRQFSKYYIKENWELLETYCARDEMPYWDWEEEVERQYGLPSRRDVHGMLVSLKKQFPDVDCSVSDYLVCRPESENMCC